MYRRIIILYFTTILFSVSLGQTNFQPMIKKIIDKEQIHLSSQNVNLIATDLADFTKKAQNSGIPQEEIDTTNKQFVVEVLEVLKREKKQTKGLQIEESDYLSARKSLFHSIVTLTILSEPDSATVTISGQFPIGSTRLEKLLDSKKSYHFIFEKNGYEKKSVDYYVNPFPDQQKLNVQLKPKK